MLIFLICLPIFKYLKMSNTNFCETTYLCLLMKAVIYINQ